jgi:hypothetical protein
MSKKARLNPEDDATVEAVLPLVGSLSAVEELCRKKEFMAFLRAKDAEGFLNKVVHALSCSAVLTPRLCSIASCIVLVCDLS